MLYLLCKYQSTILQTNLFQKMDGDTINLEDVAAAPKQQMQFPVTVTVLHEVDYSKLRNFTLIAIAVLFGSRMLLMLISKMIKQK